MCCALTVGNLTYTASIAALSQRGVAVKGTVGRSTRASHSDTFRNPSDCLLQGSSEPYFLGQADRGVNSATLALQPLGSTRLVRPPTKLWQELNSCTKCWSRLYAQ